MVQSNSTKASHPPAPKASTSPMGMVILLIVLAVVCLPFIVAYYGNESSSEPPPDHQPDPEVSAQPERRL